MLTLRSRLSLLIALVLAAAFAPAARAASTLDFTWAPNPPHVQELVTFTASGSATGYADPMASYSWDLNGDGQFGDVTGPTATQRFASVGDHLVGLQVDGGAEKYKVITVVNRPPQACFSFAPNSATTQGDPIVFTANCTDPDGDLLTYTWTFDDGTRAVSGPDGIVAHVFPAGSAGLRTVTLSVYDGHGGTAQAIQRVNVVNPRPVALFSFTPRSPRSGDEVLFDGSASTDPNGRVVHWHWSFAPNADFARVSHAFSAKSGTRIPVTLQVDDGEGARSAPFTQTFVLGDSAPRAAIDVSDAQPLTGQRVTFTARDSDRDGSVVARAWDLDGDGRFDDAHGVTAQRSYTLTGDHTVALLVTDDAGATTLTQTKVTVRNHPPLPSFRISPERPRAGQIVTLTSTSRDPDGALTAQRWDLDGDGKFDDANSGKASVVFRTPGTHQIGLQVRDNDGATATAFTTVDVTPVLRRRTRMLQPFPSVRVAGLVYRWGARFRVLTVSAGRGAAVSVRCHGRRCPRKTWSQTSRGRLLHVRPFERRLRAGVMLEVRVTKRGRIGKYTRIRVRAARAPGRFDACLRPGASRPSACRR